MISTNYLAAEPLSAFLTFFYILLISFYLSVSQCIARDEKTASPAAMPQCLAKKKKITDA